FNMRFGFWSLVFLWSLGLGAWSLEAAAVTASSTPAGAPLYFETNRGQADNSVRFLARTVDGVFCLSPTEAVITLRKAIPSAGPARGQGPGHLPNFQTRTVRLRFLGADPRARMTGAGELQGRV